jgi:5-methylcytosine-specific restriction endonuclease McrA
MEDSTPKAWSSPGGLRLPLDRGMLEAARMMYRDNRGALWTHLVSTGLLVEDTLELRANLISLFAQMDETPISLLDHAFGVNGREAWAIAQAEPIFLFWCLDCQEEILPKDPRQLRRLKRALEALRNSSVGELVSTALLCGGCTELRLHLYNEECRAARLAQQARTAQLRKMTFAEYRVQPEWQARRTAALARAGYRCQVCADHDARLDAHHNTYDRYGEESAFDLIMLCASCHELFHGIEEYAS